MAIGDDIDREKLEFISAENNGFVRYFDSENYDKREVIKIFDKIRNPIMKNVNFVINKPDVYGKVPKVFPTAFAGSYSLLAGRYNNGGPAQIFLNAENVDEPVNYTYQVEFENDVLSEKFAEKLWAKEMIDQLERKEAVFGESQAWKDSLIDLSLTYNIRCKYTAYIADYENIVISVDDEDNNLIPRSFIQNNYPNPFNPSTSFKFYLSESTLGKVKFIKIFNILGELVALIDISDLNSGWHEVNFNGEDLYGKQLSSGVYIASLQIGNEVVNSIKIVMMK